MGCYEIDHAVNDLVCIFLEEGYTEKTIVEHRRNIQRVVNLHHERGTPFYDSKIVEDYIAGLKVNYESGIISRSRKNALVKAALYVHEIATTGTVTAGARVVPDKLSPHYRIILEKAKESTEWGEALKRNVIYAAHTYFRFLTDSNIQNISDISEDVIRCYIMQKASYIGPNSVNTVRRNLKHLHRWLNKKRYIYSNFSDVLSFTMPSICKVSKPVPHDEIAQMFRVIDRDTAIGKRDYAMFIIAVVTGMRSIVSADDKMKENAEEKM